MNAPEFTAVTQMSNNRILDFTHRVNIQCFIAKKNAFSNWQRLRKPHRDNYQTTQFLERSVNCRVNYEDWQSAAPTHSAFTIHQKLHKLPAGLPSGWRSVEMTGMQRECPIVYRREASRHVLRGHDRLHAQRVTKSTAVDQSFSRPHKPRFHGNSFLAASSWHPHRHDRHADIFVGVSGVSGNFPAQLATRLPDWSAGGLLRCIVLPVCPCVVSFSKFYEYDTHNLLSTSRQHPHSILVRHVRHARFPRDVSAKSSQACDEDATRKLLPWNFSYIELESADIAWNRKHDTYQSTVFKKFSPVTSHL